LPILIIFSAKGRTAFAKVVLIRILLDKGCKPGLPTANFDGTLADPGIFDAVLDADYGRKNRINRNNTEWHIRALVFLSGKKSATNPNIEFRFKVLLFFVDRANYLVGIQHFDPLDRLNIPGGNLTLFVDVNCYGARFVVDRFKFYLLQIQDDVGYVLNDSGEGSKLVLRSSDPNGSNCSSFQVCPYPASNGSATNWA
jgi:hypothetical protein